MANVKITDLTAYTNPDTTDVLPIVDVGADVTKKISIENLLKNASSGTAAAPGIAFDGDSNTGIYRPGADQLALSTNGTGRLFVAADGKVGIGVSNPTTYLDVDSGASGTVFFKATSATISDLLIRAGSDSVNTIRLRGDNSGNFSVFTQNNQQRLSITSAGLVGIGTSAPNSALNVVNLTGDPAVLVSSGAGTAGAASLGFRTSTIPVGAFQSAIISNRTNSPAAFDTTLALQNTKSGTLSTSLFIDSSGRVGIGTTSPNTNAKLAVSNGGAETFEFQTGVTSGKNTLLSFNRSTSTWVEQNYVASEHTFNISGSSNEKMRLDSSGRLLVGTSTALGVSKLETLGNSFTSSAILARISSNSATPTGFVCAKDRAGAVVQNNDQLGACVFRGYDGSDYIDAAFMRAEVDGNPGANDMPGRLVFYVTADGASSPTERMRIASDGHTYWGVANPGATAFGTSIGRLGNLGLFQTARDVNGATEVGFFHGNAGEVRIYGDGDLENTNNSYGALSDAKLKENIVNASPQWNDLKALQVRKYNFKAETGYNTHTQIGLIAQEVELVSPGLVSESPDRDEDGNDLGTVTKSVNYSVLYMKAVKALQEAMERIETLEAKVAALESA